VFAAGIILWELLAGRRLYKAPDSGRLIDVARRAEVPALEERGLSERWKKGEGTEEKEKGKLICSQQ